jgi:uracil phosphoribosyltransferase
LIQRDEASADKHPVLFYSKLPPQIATFQNVLIVDPMLATAGSVLLAIKVRAPSINQHWRGWLRKLKHPFVCDM